MAFESLSNKLQDVFKQLRGKGKFCLLYTSEPDFKGYIHDVGGPTANFRQPACDKQLTKGACKNRQCLFPDACKNLKVEMCIRDRACIGDAKKVVEQLQIEIEEAKNRGTV